MALDFNDIELYKLPASAIMSTGEVGLLPLVPFTRGADARVIETAMRQIREEPAEQEAQKLAALLGVFATRFHGQDFALDLVRRYFMSTEILQEFPLFRSMMAEAEAKGEAKGMREIIARLLEQRFGPMSQEMRAALNAADAPALTELAVHVMNDTQEQLRQRLGLNGEQG